MLQRFTLLIGMMLMLNSLQAQLTSGSIAPDFTVTDIDGKEHNLYTYLNEGKTVILDIFATWCGPCWSYHQTHTLEDLYQELGPNGTNELMVLTIEGDGNTAVPCITGASGCNTIGDWTEGVTYPIIDSRDVAEAYSITYYPTIFLVHPNRVVYEVAQRSANELNIWIDSAEKLEFGKNPSVISFNGIDGSLCSPSWVSGPNYTVSNMGEETLTAFEYEVRNGSEVIYSNSWSGSVEPYHIATQIQVTPSIINENTNYDFYFTSINGETVEELDYSTSLTFEVENTIYVTAITDENAPSHGMTYQITDEFGFVVADGSMTSPNEEYSIRHDLPEQGCYEFTLIDQNFDGISGEVKVVDVAGNIIYRNLGLKTEMVSSFAVTAVTSVDDILDSNLMTVSPNPASMELTLNLSDNVSDVIEISILGIDGRAYTVPTQLNGNTASLMIAQLPEGLYTLVVLTEDGRGVKQFIKE